MKDGRFVNGLLKFLRTVGILTVINLAVVGLICKIAGWNTWALYSNGLLYSAGIFFAIGGFSLMGNMNFKSSTSYQYARTVGAESTMKRVDNETDSTDRSYRFLAIMGLVGAISIGFSILTGKLAGL